MTTSSIPRPAQPIAGGMTVDATWYRWLRDLEADARARGVDISESIAEIARKLGSPDGSIDGIPEQSAAQLVGIAPVNVAGPNISLETFAATVAGDIQGFVRDGFGRVTGLRPVIAGPGIVIDGTTDPAQIEIRAASVMNRITTTGDFRRTTQNDLRIIA